MADLLKMQRQVFESGLSTTAKITALALLDHWARKTETFPGVAHLSNKTGLGQSTVKKAIATLEEVGAVKVKRSLGRSNRYDFSGMMTLKAGARSNHPPRANRATSETGPGDRPVQEVDPTSPGGSSGPGQEVDTKEPTEGTQVRNPRTKRSKSSKSVPPNPDTKPLFVHYVSTFRRLFGQDLEPVSKKQIPRAMAAFKEIAEADGLEAGKALIDKALSLPWEGYHSPTGIASQRTKILAAQKPKSAGYKQDAQTPIATGTWEPRG